VLAKTLEYIGQCGYGIPIARHEAGQQQQFHHLDENNMT